MSGSPIRELQDGLSTFNRRTIAVMGDSMSFNSTLKVPPESLWPERVGVALRASPNLCQVRVRNFARSGDKTTQMRNRLGICTYYDVPDLFILEGGVNDYLPQTITTITSASTTATATCAAIHNLATGDVVTISGCTGGTATNYNITATVLTVPSTTTFTFTIVSTAGVAAAGSPTFNIPSSSTQTLLTAMLTTITAAQVAAGKTPRALVTGAHYLNFSDLSTANGDQGVAEGSSYVPWRTYRTAQAAAAAAVTGAVFLDVRASYGALITAGTYVQGDHLWQYADYPNSAAIHWNLLGHSLMAGFVVVSIQSQTGWLAALRIP